MITRAIVKLTLASSLLFSAPIFAAQSFNVAVGLTNDGSPFASPRMTVKAGSPAKVQVSGQDGYDLTVTVTEQAPDQLRVETSLETSSGSMAPVVVIKPGVPATISVGTLGITLTVRPSDG